MSYRPLKVHYAERHDRVPLCGAAAVQQSVQPENVTCRVCRFHYLANQAPWARDFLNELRAAPPDAKTSEPRATRFTAEQLAYAAIEHPLVIAPPAPVTAEVSCDRHGNKGCTHPHCIGEF